MHPLSNNVTNPILMKSDASAAIGIAHRIGVGKVRHIEVNQLWLQEKISRKEITLEKVPTGANLADALTKGVDAISMGRHLDGVGGEILHDRHALAPRLGD